MLHNHHDDGARKHTEEEAAEIRKLFAAAAATPNSVGRVALYLQNAGFAAYIRVVTVKGTSERLGESVTTSTAGTRTLTPIDGILADGDQFQFKMDVVAGSDRLSDETYVFSQGASSSAYYKGTGSAADPELQFTW